MDLRQLQGTGKELDRLRVLPHPPVADADRIKQLGLQLPLVWESRGKTFRCEPGCSPVQQFADRRVQFGLEPGPRAQGGVRLFKHVRLAEKILEDELADRLG